VENFLALHVKINYNVEKSIAEYNFDENEKKVIKKNFFNHFHRFSVN